MVRGQGYMVPALNAMELQLSFDLLYKFIAMALEIGCPSEKRLLFNLEVHLDDEPDATRAAQAIEVFHQTLNNHHGNAVLLDHLANMIDRTGYAFRQYLGEPSILESELLDTKELATCLDRGKSTPVQDLLESRRRRFAEEAERVFQQSLLDRFRVENAASF